MHDPSMSDGPQLQQLSRFRLPKGFRGRSAVVVQLWWIVQALLFKPLPQFCFPLRRGILRLFGARIGKQVRIRPGVVVTYPWKVSIGDHSWIGDNATLYSLGDIIIGANTVVSQHSYLCSADHDYTQPDFPIRSATIVIEDEVWVASHCWVGPGVTIGAGSVVAARSTVITSLPARTICVGSPCRPVRPRLPDERQDVARKRQ